MSHDQTWNVVNEFKFKSVFSLNNSPSERVNQESDQDLIMCGGGGGGGQMLKGRHDLLHLLHLRLLTAASCLHNLYSNQNVSPQPAVKPLCSATPGGFYSFFYCFHAAAGDDRRLHEDGRMETSSFSLQFVLVCGRARSVFPSVCLSFLATPLHP